METQRSQQDFGLHSVSDTSFRKGDSEYLSKQALLKSFKRIDLALAKVRLLLASMKAEEASELQNELPEQILDDYNKLRILNPDVPSLQILNQKLQEIEQRTGKTKLRLVRGLQQGRLIGYENGQFLFSDGGFKQRYKGLLGYKVTRAKVHNDGYELHTKETMKTYQSFTRQLFFNYHRLRLGSWVESGDNPSKALYVNYISSYDDVPVHELCPEYWNKYFGARCLLRV